jgi:hypothetical protein
MNQNHDLITGVELHLVPTITSAPTEGASLREIEGEAKNKTTRQDW